MKNILEWALMPQDKANHAFYGLALYSLLALVSPLLAIVLVITIGVGKEIYDEIQYGGFDTIDIVFTIALPVVLYTISLVR